MELFEGISRTQWVPVWMGVINADPASLTFLTFQPPLRVNEQKIFNAMFTFALKRMCPYNNTNLCGRSSLRFLDLNATTKRFTVIHWYLVSLVANSHPVAAVHDVMFTVVPQQAVGDGAQELLGPARHLLSLQGRLAAHVVHVVDQDLRAVGEVGHGVHSDAGQLGYDAQDQPPVGHHPADGCSVPGDHGEDVRDEVGDAVVTQVNTKVGE